MEEWKEYRYTDLATIIGGGTPKTSVPEYWSGEIPWLSVKDFVSVTKYVYDTEKHISELGLLNSSTKLLEKNDIVISARGTVGAMAMIPDPMCFNQSCFGLRGNNIVDKNFLYYLTRTKVDELRKTAHGSVFDTITRETFDNLRCLVPPLQTQQKIGNILSSLDSKIELNKRINDNLEQQAQALFKSWFVDFEPFKKGKFIDSELGMIPEGWRVGTLNELIISTLGGDWGKEDAIGNYVKKVSCIRGADIPEIRQGNRGNMPTRFILNKNFLNKALKAEDLVVEISGGSPTQSTGRICQISDTLLKKYDDVVICTNFCRAIKTKRPYSQFIYYLWEYLYKRGVMFLYENGTTGIKNLDINGLLEKEIIVIPDENTVHKYTGICNLFSQIVQSNGYESERLVRLRDTLLPKLMSGELKINDINN